MKTSDELLELFNDYLAKLPYETSEDMGKLFDLEAEGYFYTRLQNPTNDYVANKICAFAWRKAYSAGADVTCL